MSNSPDIYVLDPSYTSIAVIDEYKSFIWTERYSGHGDFKLVAQSTPALKALMKQNVNCLAQPDSEYVMMIESVLESTKAGETLLTVTGRTLTVLLATRGVSPTWVGNGVVGAVAASLVNSICAAGTGVSVYDQIPGFFVEDVTTDTRSVQTKPNRAADLYTTVKSLCDSVNVGFKITKRKSAAGYPQVWCTFYNGISRPGVQFSEDLDTLTEPSFLKSYEHFNNIAYVWHQQGLRVVSKYGVDQSTSGYARKVLTVDAMDINPADHVPAVYDSLLIQRGLEGLYGPNGKLVQLYDGQVPVNTPYKYRVDYKLGDVVTYVGKTAAEKSNVRITEYIWSCDSTGIKAYPTFSIVE